MTRDRAAGAGSAHRPGALWRATRAVALLAALALVAGALLAPRAGAAAPGGPRIVWAGEGRVYVAAPDSGALVPGIIVRVFEKEHEIAAGEIAQVVDGVLASVRLTSGRVAADARFDRLDVRLEPAPVRPVATLRVGLPASGRQALVPPCGSVRVDAGALPRVYRSEPLPYGVVRLVAADSVALVTRWPDTLLVRTFGDRADEEIALERGELDVAVFWPGEPSARLRERPAGFELLRGALERGLLVARSRRDDAMLARARIATDFTALNDFLFGFDLQVLGGRSGGPAPPDTVLPPVIEGRASRRAARFLRYEVDRRVPGQASLAMFLNRNQGFGVAGAGLVTVGWEDVPVARADSLEDIASGQRIEQVLGLRCPVLCARARADDVRALGADPFANLPACAAARKRP